MHDLSPIEWAVRPFKRYAVFSGRASRAEYWWFYLATTIGSFIVTLLEKLAADDLGVLGGIYGVALIVPQIAVSVRRLHDTDRSGWWLFIFAVPLVVLMIMGFGEGMMRGALSSGPVLIGAVVVAVGFVIGGITLLLFSVQSGTEGPNRYGDDPYGPNQLEEVFA